MVTNRSHGDGTQRSVAVKSPRGWPFGPKGPFRRHVSAATSESPARVNEALQVEALWEKSRHYKSEPVPLRELSQDPVWAQLYGQATSSRDDIYVDMRITKSMLRSHMQQKKARDNTDVSDEELLARLVDETPCPAPKYALPAVNVDDELDGPPPDLEETAALPQPEPENDPNVSGTGVSPHDLIAAALRAADVALRQVGEVPCEPTSAGDLPSGAAAQRLNHYGAIPFQSVGMEPSTKMSPMVSILGRCEHDPNIWDTEGARTMIYLSAALHSAPMQHREDRMRANGGYLEPEQDHPQGNVRPAEGNGPEGKGHRTDGYGNGGGEGGHDDDDDDSDDDRGKDNGAINGRGLAPAVQIPQFSGSAASDASESDGGNDRRHRSPASSPRSGPSSGARQQQPSPGSRRPAGGPRPSRDEPEHTTREIFPVSPSHDGSGVDSTSPDSSPRRRRSSSPDRLRHGSFLPSGGDSPSSPRSPTNSRYPSRRHRDPQAYQGQPSVDYPHRREASRDRDYRSGDESPPARARSPRSPPDGASPVRRPGRQRTSGKSGSSVPEAAAEEELQDTPADDGDERQRPKTRGYPRRVPKAELDSPDDAAERPRREQSPGRQGRGADRGGQPRADQPASPTGPAGQDLPDSMPGSFADHSHRRPALRDPAEPGPSSLPRLAEVAPDVVQPSSGRRGGPDDGSPEGPGRQGHRRAMSGSPVRTRPDGRSPSVLPRLAEVAPEVTESPIPRTPHVDDSERADTEGADTAEDRRPAARRRPGRHFPGSMTDPDNLQGSSPGAPRGSGSPTRAAPLPRMHDDSDPTHDSELRHIGQGPFDPIEAGRTGHGSVNPISDPIRNNVPETSHRGHHPMAPQHVVGQETNFGFPEPLSGAPHRSLSDPMGSREGPVEADLLPDIFHPSGSPRRSGGVDRGIPSAADVPSDFEQYLHDVEAMLDHMQDPNALPRAGSPAPGLHGNHPGNPLASIADELVDYPFPHGSPDGHSLLEITPQFAPPGQRGLLPDDRLGGYPASQDPNFRPGYVSRPDGGPSHGESGGYLPNAPMEYGSPESPSVAYPATLHPNFRPGYVHELGGGPSQQSGGHTSGAPEGSRDEPPRPHYGGYPAGEDPRYEPRRSSLPQHGSGIPHGPPYTSSGGQQDAPGIPAGDFPGTEGELDNRPGIGSQAAGTPPQFKSGGHQSNDGQGQRGPQPDLQAGGYPATQDPNFRPRMRQSDAEEDTAPADLSGERAAEIAVPRVPGDPGMPSDPEPRPSSKYKVTPYRRPGNQLSAASGLAQDPFDESKLKLSGPDGVLVHGNPDEPQEPPGGEMASSTASRGPGHASAPDGALPPAPGQQQHFLVSTPEPELPQKRHHDDGSTSLPTDAGPAPSSRYQVTPYESSDNHPDQSTQEGTQRPSSKYKVTPYNPDLPSDERQQPHQADSIVPGHGNQSPRHGTWENALADTRHNLGQPRFRVPVSPRQSVLWTAVPDSPLSRTVLAPSTIPGDVHSPRLPVDENPLFDLNNGSTDAGSGRSLDGLAVLPLTGSGDSRGPAHPHDHAQHRAHPGPGVAEAGGTPGRSGSNGNEGEPHRKKGIPVGRVAAKMRRERKTPWQSTSSNDSEDESAGNEGSLPPESLSGGRRTPAAAPDVEGSPHQPHHPHLADDVASLDAWNPQQEPSRRNRGHSPALQAVEEGPEFWRDGGVEEAVSDGPRVSPRQSLRQSFASLGSADADEDEPWLPGQEERMENRPATRQSASGHGGRAVDGPSRHHGSPEGSAAEAGRRSLPSGTGSQHGASGERPGEPSSSGSSGPVGLRLESNPLVPRRPGRDDSAASGNAPRGPWSSPDAQHPHGEEADTSPPGTSWMGPRMPAHDISVYPDPRPGSSASTTSYGRASDTGDGDFGDPDASGRLARSRREPARNRNTPSSSPEQHGNPGIGGRSRSGQDPYAAQGPPRGNADARSIGGSPQLRSPLPSQPASPSRPVPGDMHEGHHSPPQDYQLQPPPRSHSSSPLPGHSQPEQGQSQEADDIRRQRGRDRDRRPRRHSPSPEVASDFEASDEGYSPAPGRRSQSSRGPADQRSGPEAPRGRPYSRASVSPSRSENSSGVMDQHGRSPDSPRYPRDALLPHQLSPSGSLDSVWEQVRPRPPGIAPTQQQPPSLAGSGNQRPSVHQPSEGMQAPTSMAPRGHQTTPRRRSLSDSDVSEDESSNAYSLPAESWELGVRPFSSVPGRTTAPPAAEGRPMPSTRVSQPGGDEPSSSDSDSDYSDPLARRRISGSVSGGDSDVSSAPDIPGWSEVPAGNGGLQDEELDASEAEAADSISPYLVPGREDRPTSESPNANMQQQNRGSGSSAPGGGSPGGSGPRVNQSPVRPGSFLTDRGLRWSQSASPTSSSDSDISHEDEDAAPGHSIRRVPSRQDATGPTQRSPREAVRPSRPVHDSDASSSDDDGPALGRRPGPSNRPARSNSAAETPGYSPGQPPVPPINRDTQVAKEAAAAANPHGRLQLVRVMRWPENEDGVGLALLKICFRAWRLLTWVKESDEDRNWATAMLSHQRLALALLYSTRVEAQPELADRLWPRRDAHRLLDSGLDKMRLVVKESKNAAGSSNPGVSEEEEPPRPRDTRPAPTRVPTPLENAARPARRRQQETPHPHQLEQDSSDASSSDDGRRVLPPRGSRPPQSTLQYSPGQPSAPPDAPQRDARRVPGAASAPSERRREPHRMEQGGYSDTWIELLEQMRTKMALRAKRHAFNIWVGHRRISRIVDEMHHRDVLRSPEAPVAGPSHQVESQDYYRDRAVMEEHERWASQMLQRTQKSKAGRVLRRWQAFASGEAAARRWQRIADEANSQFELQSHSSSVPSVARPPPDASGSSVERPTGPPRAWDDERLRALAGIFSGMGDSDVSSLLDGLDRSERQVIEYQLNLLREQQARDTRRRPAPTSPRAATNQASAEPVSFCRRFPG